MNFKYFIISIYLAFVLLIMLMVFKSCGQNIDLETKDYYAEELKYQSRIDAKTLGNVYADSFSVVEEGDFIRIRQPLLTDCDSVIVLFKKPDNAAADRMFRFAGNAIAPFPKTSFNKGVYGLSIRVFTRRGEMLIEKKIRI